MSTSYGDGPSGRRDDIAGSAAGSTAGASAAGPARVPDHGTTPVQREPRDLRLDRDAVVARQEDRFGGIKWGSAFFGWLTATGLAALLTSLLAAGGTALGVANNASVEEVVGQTSAATDTAQTVGLTGGIALLVILFVSYFAGGYVAGRMARFAGTRQGLAVWLWAVLIAVVVAVLAAVAGSAYNVLATLNLPRIPVDEGTLTTGGIIALLAIAVASLVGALLGGKTGMRYHRRVDDAGLR